MTGGIITGGWGYVWAAYGISFFALGSYATSVVLRLRAERRRETAAERGPAPEVR